MPHINERSLYDPHGQSADGDFFQGEELILSDPTALKVFEYPSAADRLQHANFGLTTRNSRRDGLQFPDPSTSVPMFLHGSRTYEPLLGSDSLLGELLLVDCPSPSSVSSPISVSGPPKELPRTMDDEDVGYSSPLSEALLFDDPFDTSLSLSLFDASQFHEDNVLRRSERVTPLEDDSTSARLSPLSTLSSLDEDSGVESIQQSLPPDPIIKRNKKTTTTVNRRKTATQSKLLGHKPAGKARAIKAETTAVKKGRTAAPSRARQEKPQPQLIVNGDNSGAQPEVGVQAGQRRRRPSAPTRQIKKARVEAPARMTSRRVHDSDGEDGDYIEPDSDLDDDEFNPGGRNNRRASRGKKKERLPCPLEGCLETFSRKHDIERHIKTSNQHNQVKVEENTLQEVALPGVSCPQCTKKLSRTDSLKRHIESDACKKHSRALARLLAESKK